MKNLEYSHLGANDSFWLIKCQINSYKPSHNLIIFSLFSGKNILLQIMEQNLKAAVNGLDSVSDHSKVKNIPIFSEKLATLIWTFLNCSVGKIL